MASLTQRLSSLLGGRKGEGSDAPGFDRTAVAAAALMVEMARLDTDFDASERDRILAIVKDKLKVDDREMAVALISHAEHRHDDVYSDWLFTETIRREFDLAERRHVVGMLWEVAYADGELAELEADLILRVSRSLELPEHERIEALREAIGRGKVPAWSA